MHKVLISMTALELAGCSAGGLFGGAQDNGVVTPQPQASGPTPSLNAQGLAIYLETMQALVEGDTVRQAEHALELGKEAGKDRVVSSGEG